MKAQLNKETSLLEDAFPANDSADDMLAILYQKLLNTPKEVFGDTKGARK